MECLEAYMKILPSTPEKQYLTETQMHGGRFSQSLSTQEVATIKQSLGTVTNAFTQLKGTVDFIQDSQLDDKTLETRMFAVENEVRNLLGAMEGFTLKWHKLTSGQVPEQTRLIELETSQDQTRTSVSKLQDYQSILEGVQNSME